MPINTLPTTTDPLTSNDSIPYAKNGGGTTYQAPLSDLLAYFTSNFASPEFTVQTAVPLSGATQTIGAVTSNVWLQIRPAGTIANLAIALPASTSAVDGQQVLVTTNQDITALTVTSAGATVIAAPTTLNNGSAFVLRYDLAALQWICVSQSFKLQAGTSPLTFSGGAVSLIGSTVTIFATGALSLQSLSGEIEAGATLDMGAFAVKQTSQTVASLPLASSEPGGRRIVNNANSTTFASNVAGGGANIVPVFSNGTTWVIG